MEISIVGKNIKKIREAQNMSQAELVRKAGVGKATINEIENGKRQSLNSNTVNKISNALNVRAEELFMEDDQEEYCITDVKEAFNLILSSDELTLNNEKLTNTERNLIEETLNDTLDFIIKKRKRFDK